MTARPARLVPRTALVAVPAAALAAGLCAPAFASAQATAPATTVSVSAGRPGGTVDPMLLGGNGRFAYHNFGSVDPKTHKLYPDFVRALRQSGITSVRFPGGTIANLYHWQRAIGPQRERGMQINASPQSLEPVSSEFGPDEYGRMTDRLGQRGIVVVNFSTGTPREAANLVEYMTGRVGQNRNGGVDWARVRARNGHRAPYDVRYWEVGNEMSIPGQYYWRAGTSATKDPVQLYAGGGSTTFTHQTVGMPDDYRDSAAVSDGTAAQSFVAKYAPVRDPQVYVKSSDGTETPWTRVAHLGTQPAGATAYTLDPRSGRIRFGDGTHGAVPPKGDSVDISYVSGRHPGFGGFYAAMKRANPRAQVCAGLSGVPANQEFAKLMGRKHPYDCLEQHAYVGGPSTSLDADDYHGELMQETQQQVSDIEQIQQAVRDDAGARARRVKVVASEYGELGNPFPVGNPDYHASLSQGLFMASDLAAFVRLGLPVADKSNLTDFVNSPPPAGATAVGAPLNAMIAGPGPNFELAPTGLVPRVFGPLAGGRQVSSSVAGNPARALPDGTALPALVTVAARRADGTLELIVINRDAHNDVTSTVRPGMAHRPTADTAVLDGESILSRNAPDVSAPQVTISRHRIGTGHGAFEHVFPAHSVTRIELTPDR